MDVFEWVTALILEAKGDPAAARRSLEQHGTGSSHSATSAPGRASAPTSCGSILPQAIAAMPPM